jgi:hypothetical protein
MGNSLFNSLLFFSPAWLACFTAYYFFELTKLSEFKNSVNQRWMKSSVSRAVLLMREGRRRCSFSE